MLPTDLKHYKASDLGAFQILTGDQCVLGLTLIIILCVIVPEILK